jgi:hypothetical protein
MKRTALIMTVFGGMALGSCNNDASVTITKDSAKNKVEVTEKTLDSTAESLKDSAKNKWKEIKDKVEHKLENADTTEK